MIAGFAFVAGRDCRLTGDGDSDPAGEDPTIVVGGKVSANISPPGPASITSTRRFRARPAAVSFEATGSASPKPCANIMLGLTPCEIIKCITLSARIHDNTRLLVMPWRMSFGSIGPLSV